MAGPILDKVTQQANRQDGIIIGQELFKDLLTNLQETPIHTLDRLLVERKTKEILRKLLEEPTFSTLTEEGFDELFNLKELATIKLSLEIQNEEEFQNLVGYIENAVSSNNFAGLSKEQKIAFNVAYSFIYFLKNDSLKVKTVEG